MIQTSAQPTEARASFLIYGGSHDSSSIGLLPVSALGIDAPENEELGQGNGLHYSRCRGESVEGTWIRRHTHLARKFTAVVFTRHKSGYRQTLEPFPAGGVFILPSWGVTIPLRVPVNANGGVGRSCATG